MTATVAPYGSWRSPVTAELLVADVVRLSSPSFDDGNTYWVESRPQEAGRNVIVRRTPDGVATDALPAGFAARTLVHEYGGRCHTARKGVLYFSNFEDQRLYRLDPGAEPVAITDSPPSPRAWRYADPVLTPDGSRLICVRERHENGEVINDLVILPTGATAAPAVLVGGSDFYAAPALSKDGRRLAWISWVHPQMPWDGTELHEAELTATYAIRNERIVCGGPEESVVQPRYGEDGTLLYISDRTGWWNLYADSANGPTALAPLEVEFAGPAWVFGTSTYAPRKDGSIVVTWSKDGASHLGVVPAQGGQPVEVPTEWSYITAISEHEGVVLAGVGSPTRHLSLVEIELSTGASSVIKASAAHEFDPAYVSVAEPIEFPTEDGLTAHALFYAPTNLDFCGPDGALPPLIVESHGGPTGQTDSVLDSEHQYWTSRGFAVVDVNYGGSTGYGRDYRERLRGAWGVVDLDDWSTQRCTSPRPAASIQRRS